MKSILTIFLIGCAAIALLFVTVSTAGAQTGGKEDQSAGDTISILNYSLKPVGYISEDRFVSNKVNAQLQNNEETDHNVNFKIKFLDKDHNTVKEVVKEVKIKGGQTKQISHNVLLDSDTAKKVHATKAVIEDIK